MYIDFTKNLKYPPETLTQGIITLRICLSVVNSIYDPLGLVVPVTIRLRVAFRDLFRPGLNLSWDDPIPAEDHATWLQLFTMLINSKPIEFRRATSPPHTTGKSQLICFFDGSDHAFACVT